MIFIKKYVRIHATNIIWGAIKMIGLGSWACSVNSMFFSGEVKFKVFDDNGKYGFEIDIPGITVPDINVIEVVEEDDTINATVQTSILEGKDINLFVEFDGDTFDGYLKIPFIGKVKFKDGHKIAE